jgi:hypothetical protein
MESGSKRNEESKRIAELKKQLKQANRKVEVLEDSIDILKKGCSHLCKHKTPEVTYCLIKKLSSEHSLTKICKLFKSYRSGNYNSLKEKSSKQKQGNVELLKIIN